MSRGAESIDRSMHPLFQAGERGSIPTSALHLRFHATDRETFAKFNRRWHSTLPKIGASGFRVCYLAECCGVVYAVAAWSNPVARMLPQREWLELRRFAIADDAPRNTASRMLGWMARDVQRRFPDVVRLISYQDCEVHSGSIYKAASWSPAEGYTYRKPRVGWGSRHRAGKTNQPTAARMRWELRVKHEPH